MVSSILKIIALLILIIVSVVGYAQIPTYTIDTNFNTGELFRSGSPVYDFHFMDDGRYLVGGAYANWGISPVFGLGMIYPTGQLDNSWEGNGYEFYNVVEIIAQEDGYIWPTIYGLPKTLLNGIPWSVVYNESWGAYFAGGTFNPYNVLRVWDIYQLENGDLLIGGAIATDTLQPGLFRGLTRIHADGSHDPTFPIINITPNNAGGAVRKIYPAPNGSWYISGSFTAINGHETNHVARLSSDFEVDTTFVSPFMYDGPVNYTEDIILVDGQSRVWVSGYNMRLLENPNDIIQLCRLLPDGILDTSFPLTKLKSLYPDYWMTWKPNFARGANEIEAYPGNYLIYGSYSHYNDTLQPCITVVNDVGVIQDNFFQGQGATRYTPYDDDDFIYPALSTIEQLDDGGLLIGGGFSEFMGETHYSVVKLKQGFVGVEELKRKIEFNLYPNPAIEKLNVSLQSAFAKSGVIYNAMGMQVLTFQFKNQETQVDITTLQPGIYFLKVQLETGQVGVRKFVKIR